jgi:DNA-binding LytR/AlgR family response regulator
MSDMRVLIIEDEAPAYRRLHNLLDQNSNDFEILDVIDSVSDAVKWLRNHKMPELIFSDIQLSDGLSFEIFDQVSVACPIIFTTAYDAFMLEAFKTNGIDYLLKPLQSEDLNRSLEKFRRFNGGGEQPALSDIEGLLAAMRKPVKSYKSRFLVKLGSKLLPVLTADIAWFAAADGLVELRTRSGKSYFIDQPLDELEASLDPERFFRINRQFLAQVDSIETIHQFFKGKLKVILNPMPAAEVIVSRDKARTFRNWVGGTYGDDPE